MRINNFFLPQLTVGPSEAKPEIAARSDAPATTLQEPAGHSLSPELLGLIQRVHQDSEVRPDVVLQAKQKLSQGLYATQSSADQTAAAILQAQD